MLIAFFLAALAAILYMIATTRPTQDSYYPKCQFYQFTGLHCPGCGTGRALHFALNGDISAAIEQNLFALIALPLIGYTVLKPYIWRNRNRNPRILPGSVIWLIFIFIVAFWVLRNIPIYPFTLLAPHEL